MSVHVYNAGWHDGVPWVMTPVGWVMGEKLSVFNGSGFATAWTAPAAPPEPRALIVTESATSAGLLTISVGGDTVGINRVVVKITVDGAMPYSPINGPGYIATLQSGVPWSEFLTVMSRTYQVTPGGVYRVAVWVQDTSYQWSEVTTVMGTASSSSGTVLKTYTATFKPTSSVTFINATGEIMSGTNVMQASGKTGVWYYGTAFQSVLSGAETIDKVTIQAQAVVTPGGLPILNIGAHNHVSRQLSPVAINNIPVLNPKKVVSERTTYAPNSWTFEFTSMTGLAAGLKNGSIRGFGLTSTGPEVTYYGYPTSSGTITVVYKRWSTVTPSRIAPPPVMN